MKKSIISILMIVFLLLSACSEENRIERPDETNKPVLTAEPTEEPAETPAEVETDVPEETMKPDEEPMYNAEGLYTGEIRIFFPYRKSMTPSEDYVKEWETYIHDKYGLKIKLVYTEAETRGMQFADDTLSGPDMEDLKEQSGDKGGLVYVFGQYNLGDLARSGLITPVNEYIKGIEELNVLNDYVIKQFSDVSDDIWGLPVWHQNSSSIRMYNGDWIKAYGRGVPKEIDELTDYAAYVKNHDPDGNGEADSILQMFRYNMLFTDFMDVFHAFGCYPTQTCYAFGYNPISDTYENCIFSEGFESAMNYLKYLLDEGLIAVTDIYPNAAEELPYKAASTYMFEYGELGECESYEAGFYLRGYNEESLVKLEYEPYCFAVLEGTKHVDAMMNSLFHVLSTYPDSYMDFWSGIQGKSYTDMGDYFSYTYRDSAGDSIPQITIWTNVETKDTEPKPYLYQSYGYKAEEMITLRKIYDDFNESITEIDEKEVYIERYIDSGNLIDSINRRTTELTKTLIQSLLTGEGDFDSLVDSYRNSLENAGILDALEEFNAERVNR